MGTELTRKVETDPVRKDLSRFERMLLEQLATAGLPTDDVLVGLEERTTALSTIDRALAKLPSDDRERSYYVSKMIAAAAAGLFDAALNYLWNETVNELRRRVAEYDLAYFFDIAVSSPDRRKHLSTADDLLKIDDVDLLRAAQQIGLLSTNGHAQLDHIRYMRNFASAAHPNQIELTGLQLASWLETCIRQVITLPYDTITAETKKLLVNIKSRAIGKTDAESASAFFGDLPGERADSLAAGLFGLYVDPAKTSDVSANVLLLWPLLWPFVSEEARQGFGIRYGRYLASLDADHAQASRELLELAKGTAYFPEKERAVEIDMAIDALLAAHHAWGNFHTEPAPARALAALIGKKSKVPTAVLDKYLASLVEVFLGNAYGISWAAVEIYEDMLDKITSEQASRALRTFAIPTISAKLWSEVGRKQWAKLLQVIGAKLTRDIDLELFDAVVDFTGPPEKLIADSKIRTLLEAARGERPKPKFKKRRR